MCVKVISPAPILCRHEGIINYSRVLLEILWALKHIHIAVYNIDLDDLLLWKYFWKYRQTSTIRRSLVENQLVDYPDVVGAPVGALHSRLNTWLQWIGQRQLQSETRIISSLVFDAAYIRHFMVLCVGGTCAGGIPQMNNWFLIENFSLV